MSIQATKKYENADKRNEKKIKFFFEESRQINHKNESRISSLSRLDNISDPDKLECPYQIVGCPGIEKSQEDLEKHFNNAMQTHNHSLLESAIELQNSQINFQVDQENDRKIFKDLEIKVINLFQTQIKQMIANQGLIKHFPEELRSSQSKIIKLAKLLKELKAINDAEIRQLTNQNKRLQNKINNIESVYQKRMNNLQREIVKLENKLKRIEKTFETVKDKGDKSKTETIDCPRKKSLNMIEEHEKSISEFIPSILLEIMNISYKIKYNQEMWSKYFKSEDDQYTMRLWFHPHGINDVSVMRLELLIWIGPHSENTKIDFHGNVTIMITNKANPDQFDIVSRKISIVEPNYSFSFYFNYKDLNKKKVLENDSIVIKCIVVTIS